jgi:hypothetical protein
MALWSHQSDRLLGAADRQICDGWDPTQPQEWWSLENIWPLVDEHSRSLELEESAMIVEPTSTY